MFNLNPSAKNYFHFRYFIILALLINTNLLYSQSITIISPNGGEKWEANSVQTITWKSTGVANVKVEYSLNGGYSWHIIEKSFDALLEKYSWTIVNAQSPYFLIRISDASNPLLNDISDNEFSVKVPSKNKLSKVTTVQIKLMPLGDSITNGDGDPDDNGYRRSLYQQLINAGYNINFIGSLIGGTPDFDRDHEGHGGWSAYLENNDPFGFALWDDVPSILDANPPDNHPDIVLLHIGTNDIGTHYTGADAIYNDTPQSLADEVKMILDRIDSVAQVKNYSTTVFLARIINRNPNNDPYNDYQRTTDFNIELQNRANTLIAQGRKIVVVNMEAALNYPADLSDDKHPNTTGYQKMANAWFHSIQGYYQPVLVGPDSNAVDRPVNVTLNWNAPPAANGSTVYELQVATDIAFTNIVFSNASISNTEIQPTGLKFGTLYYWRVRIPDYGWSAIWNFTTEPMQVFAKIFLQGPYNSGAMNTNLRTLSDFPKAQPYNVSPWNYSGNENVTNVPADIVDWVLIQLRSAYNGTAVAARAAFLKN
ncbi:MAG TPA: GDSL-type esterase/lipase family protein, partial [Ignavibacteriaceae bacterium]|nr:GDSL-type esterase/lipase family protein [Ignavibacteriaceae bacterium]